MAIVGMGIDIVQIARIDSVWQKQAERFTQRLLHAQEQTEFQQVTRQQASRWLAKRWAAKEAAAKALGTGFRQGVALTDFIYLHDPLGKPLLAINGKAAELAANLHWHISLSDEQDYVVASVIIEN